MSSQNQKVKIQQQVYRSTNFGSTNPGQQLGPNGHVSGVGQGQAQIGQQLQRTHQVAAQISKSPKQKQPGNSKGQTRVYQNSNHYNSNISPMQKSVKAPGISQQQNTKVQNDQAAAKASEQSALNQNHRRSNTDGSINIQNSLANASLQRQIQNDNKYVSKIIKSQFLQDQFQHLQSRQNATNKGLHIQGLSVNNASKNLKLQQYQDMREINDQTRNSNLPKKQAKTNDTRHLQQSISIEQLQELMKNPQIAQFLQEQILIQQNQNNAQKLQSNQHMVNQQYKPVGNCQKPPQQHNKQLMQQISKGTSSQMNVNNNQFASGQSGVGAQATKISPRAIYNESNLNSDTSQEILMYQIEWAKKFNEHVDAQNTFSQTLENFNKKTPDQQNVLVQKSGQGNIADSSELLKIAGADHNRFKQMDIDETLPSNTVQNQQTDSSLMTRQQIDERNDEKQNILPFTVVKNNMENLNKEIQSHQNNINFYNEVGPETEGSIMLSAQLYNDDIYSKTQYTEQAEPIEITGQDDNNEGRSRNIMNGGKQLTLMTIRSDVLDCSADLDLDALREDSDDSYKDEEDEYLTFQLCEGEEMNNQMANFISIHMLNDGYVDQDGQDNKPNQEGGFTYQCPQTGSHFEFVDLVGRMRTLKQKRQIIDEALRQEEERQKVVRRQKEQNQHAKIKQIQKQRKQKTQVQNIIKSAQEDEENENLIDSMHHSGNIITESDLLILEDEDHLQTHHITANMKINAQTHHLATQQDRTDKNFNQVSQQYSHAGGGNKSQFQIYNTHDGRLQQKKLEGDAMSHQNQLRTHANNPNQFFEQKQGQSNQQATKTSIGSSGKFQNNIAGKQITVGKTSSGNQEKQKCETAQSIQMNYQTQNNTKHQGLSQTSTTGGGVTFSIHQASSLGSNHASKIQNQMAKQNPQDDPNNKISLHDQNQQMIMNLRQNQQEYINTNSTDLQSQQKNKKQKSSNEVQYRTLMNFGQSGQVPMIGGVYDRQRFQENHGGTMINSNQLSSMIQSGANNSNQLNTALGSHRGNSDQKPKQTKISSNQKQPQKSQNIKQQPNNLKHSIHQSHLRQQFDAGNIQNQMQQQQGSTQLKQTAQFGPQMNLIKSQLPHQQSNNVAGSNRMQSHYTRNQQVLLGHQSRGNINQNNIKNSMQATYLTQFPQSHNENELEQFRQTDQLNGQQNKKIISKANNASWSGKNYKQPTKVQNIDNGISGSMHSTGMQNYNQMSNIIQQNQLKSKFVSIGPSQHNYTNKNFDQSQPRQFAEQKIGANSSSIVRSTGSQNQNVSSMGGSVGVNSKNQSIGRQTNISNVDTQKEMYPMPQTVQSQSKKLHQNKMMPINQYFTQGGQGYNQIVNPQKDKAVNKIVKNRGAANQNHFQSYSFDYRQQQQNQNSNQQYGAASNIQFDFNGQGQVQPDQQHSKLASKQQMGHPMSNMRSFDTANPANGQAVQQKAQGFINPVNQPQKQKSSSQQQPKESNHDDEIIQQSESTLGNAKIQTGLQHKKVKSTSNQIFQKGSKAVDPSRIESSQMNPVQANARVSYNSMGATTKVTNSTKIGDAIQATQRIAKNPNQHINSGQSFNDQQIFGQQQVAGNIQPNLINQPGFDNIANNAQAMVQTKAKRVTAATREVHSGTNARVSTFDNRGLQAQNAQYAQQQYQQQQQRNAEQQFIPNSQGQSMSAINQPSNTKLNAPNSEMYQQIQAQLQSEQQQKQQQQHVQQQQQQQWRQSKTKVQQSTQGQNSSMFK